VEWADPRVGLVARSAEAVPRVAPAVPTVGRDLRGVTDRTARRVPTGPPGGTAPSAPAGRKETAALVRIVGTGRIERIERIVLPGAAVPPAPGVRRPVTAGRRPTAATGPRGATGPTADRLEATAGHARTEARARTARTAVPVPTALTVPPPATEAPRWRTEALRVRTGASGSIAATARSGSNGPPVGGARRPGTACRRRTAATAPPGATVDPGQTAADARTAALLRFGHHAPSVVRGPSVVHAPIVPADPTPAGAPSSTVRSGSRDVGPCASWTVRRRRCPTT